MSSLHELLEEVDLEIFDPQDLPPTLHPDGELPLIIPPQDTSQVLLLLMLSGSTIPALRKIAKGMGWSLEGRSRAKILPQMLAHYRSPASLRQAWRTLSEEEHNFLATVAVLPAGSFLYWEGMLVELEDWRPEDWPYPADPFAALRRLCAAGFVHAIDDERTELLSLSPGFVALATPPPFLRPARIDAAAQAPDADPVAAVWAAGLVLRDAAVAPEVPRLREDLLGIPKSWPPKDGLWGAGMNSDTYVFMPPEPSPFSEALCERLRATAECEGAGSARFYLAMAYLLEHLEQPLPGDPHDDAGTADGLDAVLNADAPTRLRILLSRWALAGQALYDELALAMEQHGGIHLLRIERPWCSPTSYFQQLFEWRMETVDLTAFLLPTPDNPEGWFEAGPFCELLADLLPQAFLLPPDFAAFIMLEDQSRLVGVPGSAEDRRIRAGIWSTLWQGPMRWLGVVETAVDAQGELLALRLSPVMLDFLGRPELADDHVAAAGMDEAAPALRWEAEMGVSIGSGTRGALLVLLARWTRHLGVEDGRSRYRFTPAKARAAFEAGHGPDELRAALAAADHELPDAHGATLDRWWARWGLVHTYDDIAIVELAEPLLRRELLADQESASLVLCPIGERALAVRESQVPRLLERLEARGYRPMVKKGRR